jgi:putative nucleotidyltransferase with HDIG domain
MNDKQFPNELERSQQALALAYESTIEVLIRALDMRDRETAGHTLRVTELTLKLAHAMGISDEELIHIRRGALLHDIGKLGIPDAILFKPGILTEAEWKVMQQHPFLGYSLLAPIAFLQPALDIVYCHHERWDGSGYPRGLKGEEIPLTARVFALADVWDALVADHPYRRGWSADNVILYIKDQAGKMFDPQVVTTFLTLVHD